MLQQFSLFLICSFLLQGCQIPAANDPFTQTPRSNQSVWTPPTRATPCLSSYCSMEEELPFYSRDEAMSLAEMIDVALTRNPATERSWAAARVSAAEYGQSLKNYFVSTNITGGYARTRSAEFTGKTRSIIYEKEYGGALEFAYTILDFGQTRLTSEAALQSLYNANWSHNRQIEQIIQTLTTRYYSYLYQKELLLSREQDVINAQVSLTAAEEKFRQGLADISDIVQAKTSYLSQKLAVVNQKQSLHSAYTNLVIAMGLPSNQEFYFQEYPGKISIFPLETLDQLIVQAYNNRSDLFAAEAHVKAAQASLAASKREKFPVITGKFDVGRKYFQRGVNDHYDFTAQVNIKFPLFQGFFIKNSIKKARANLEQTQALLKEMQLTILQEVSNYRSATIYAKESLAYAQPYLESAEEDLKVQLKKYRVGTGTVVDLINAQTAVADAKAQLARAQHNWYTSIADLAYATGLLIPASNGPYSPRVELIKQKEEN